MTRIMWFVRVERWEYEDDEEPPTIHEASQVVTENTLKESRGRDTEMIQYYAAKAFNAVKGAVQ